MKDNQRIALTKRLLQEGLLRLLDSKPLKKISVSELCKESGINRATFYRHYELPRDVLNDLEHEFLSGMNMESWIIESNQDIIHYSEVALKYWYEHADIMKVLLKNRSDEEFTRIINELCTRFFALNLRLPGMEDIDKDSLRLISAFTVGGIYFLLRQWLQDGIQKTPEEVSAMILRLLSIGGGFNHEE